MKRLTLLSLLFPVLAAAQTPHLDPEQLAARIRETLNSRGVNLAEVTHTAKQGRRKPEMETSARLKLHIDSAGPSVAPALVDQVSSTFSRLYSVYKQLGALYSPPDLYLNTSPVINAYAANGAEIQIYVALSELVYDSPSELAFAVAHEMGHIVQQRSGLLLFVEDNAEFDADVWGVLAVLLAGYDPYSGSGTLAKLSMVTGDVGLMKQFENQSADDAHKSFVTRIAVMYEALTGVCSINSDFQQLCTDYRTLVHPHFPDKAVL